MAFPEDRPIGYDPDKLWDEDTAAWYATTTPTGAQRLAQAGGRYQRQLVVLSEEGQIYFGAIQ